MLWVWCPLGKEKKSSCSIFPEAGKALWAHSSPLIWFSFSQACILLTHFLIYPFWIAQWVASFLGSKNLLGDAVSEQKCTQTPNPSAGKKSPSVILSGESTHCVPPTGNAQALWIQGREGMQLLTGWRPTRWLGPRWRWKAILPIPGKGFPQICHLATSYCPQTQRLRADGLWRRASAVHVHHRVCVTGEQSWVWNQMGDYHLDLASLNSSFSSQTQWTEVVLSKWSHCPGKSWRIP